MSTLNVYEYRNAYILPHRPDENSVYGIGGLVSSDGNFVKESGFKFCNNYTDHLDWGGYYSFEKEKIRIIDEEIVFAGFINNNEWGHFIADWSIRLWYAMEIDLPIYFCCREKRMEILKNIQDLIRLCGIDLNRIHVIMSEEMPYRFSKVYLPEASLTAIVHSTEFLKPFRCAVANAKTHDLPLRFGEKIYLTRTQMKNCKEVGEKYIENIFEKNGFQIVAPERLSVVEQVCMFAGCRELASLDGSAPHGIVFCRNGVNHIILEKTNDRNFRQEVLDVIANATVRYVKAWYFNNSKVDTMGPFLVGITGDVRSFCEEKNFICERRTGLFHHFIIYCWKYFKWRYVDKVIRRVRRGKE